MTSPTPPPPEPPTEETESPETTPTESPTDETASPTESPTNGTASPTNGTASPTNGAAAPFGPACGDLPESGEGSLESMAGKPISEAVGEHPELSTLMQALSESDLSQQLDSAQAVTLFAPTDDAFTQVPRAELDRLMGDKDQLTSFLNAHVVEREVTQQDLSNGRLETADGGQLQVTGSGEDFTVNGEAKITCGAIPVKNGLLYLIDKPLMPE